MRVGYVFDLRFFFLEGIKTFEISAYIQNLIFTKNVNKFDIPRQSFP